RTTVRLAADKSGAAREQSVQGMQLLNAINSPEVPDGNYLYNPVTGKVEVQWIHGIGSDKAAAPQARLMATVINGILTHKLPWGLILLGVFLVIAVELLGIRSLSFAVGFYIPMATTLAIFCGGVVRWLVERAAAKAGKKAEESDVSPGSLYASGLIAAGGIVGLLGIAIKVLETQGLLPENSIAWGTKLSFIADSPAVGNVIAVLMFCLLSYSLFYFARKPLEGEKK
ncbi:MAG TPA: OPT/YSL family transporter, partial [Candidatus Sulfotelmatobacter sp.]|nr:OPT/YSL family transporter [Candidatus Sulfotelmatobacter sp.]